MVWLCGGRRSETERRNFDKHDLDGNERVSFLERKFVAADLNKDRKVRGVGRMLSRMPRMSRRREGCEDV